jgi:hypothetical protein
MWTNTSQTQITTWLTQISGNKQLHSESAEAASFEDEQASAHEFWSNQR